MARQVARAAVVGMSAAEQVRLAKTTT
jgi:hypothetical protein